MMFRIVVAIHLLVTAEGTCSPGKDECTGEVNYEIGDMEVSLLQRVRTDNSDASTELDSIATLATTASEAKKANETNIKFQGKTLSSQGHAADPTKCTWMGKAPFCSAGDKPCQGSTSVECTGAEWAKDPGWPDDPPFGKDCANGVKKLCCETQDACPPTEEMCQWRNGNSCTLYDDKGLPAKCGEALVDPGWYPPWPDLQNGMKTLCCPTQADCAQFPFETGLCGWIGEAPFCSGGTYHCEGGKPHYMGYDLSDFFGDNAVSCDVSSSDPGFPNEPPFGKKCETGEKQLCCASQAACPSQ